MTRLELLCFNRCSLVSMLPTPAHYGPFLYAAAAAELSIRVSIRAAQLQQRYILAKCLGCSSRGSLSACA